MEDEKTSSPVANHPDTIGPWRIGRTIGRDRVFPIRIARHLQHDVYAAVKIVPLSRFSPSPYLATTTSDNTLNDLEHELALMKLISHPNILALYDVWESQRETFVITEYSGGGDLFAHLQENNIHNLSSLATYFHQIMSAVAYCHSLNVTFHGLQTDSLQLDEPKEMIKLISFDTAKLETNISRFTLGKRKDIWSCAMILFKLLSGNFELDIEMESWAQFSPPSNRIARPPELPDGVPQPAKDLFDSILMARNRNLKLTPISDLLSYSFFDLVPQLAVNKEKDPSSLQAADLTAKMIDFNTYSELRVLLHQISEQAIQKNLLRKGSSIEKMIYSLLAAHRLESPYYALLEQSPSITSAGPHLQVSRSAATSMNELSKRILSYPTTASFKSRSASFRLSPPTIKLPPAWRGKYRRRTSTAQKRDSELARPTMVSEPGGDDGARQVPPKVAHQPLLGLGILRYPLSANEGSGYTIDRADCNPVNNMTAEGSRMKHARNAAGNDFDRIEVQVMGCQNAYVDSQKIRGHTDNFPPTTADIAFSAELHPNPDRKRRPRRLVKANPTNHPCVPRKNKIHLKPTNKTREALGIRSWLGIMVPGVSQVSASLLSAQDIRTTKEECTRLLQTFHVLVDPNPVQTGTLRCKLMDNSDSGTRTHVHLRFIVKFSHVTSSSHLLAGFVSSFRLIKEKGSTTSFRHIYNRLRHEWDLDDLSISTVKEEDLAFHIVPSPAIVFSGPT